MENTEKVLNNVSESEVYRFLTLHWHHHNQLAWSKLYVLLALEAATLTGSFSVAKVSHYSSFWLLLAGSLVAIILYRLMLRDWQVRDYMAEKLNNVHNDFSIEILPPPKNELFRGRNLLKIIIAILALINISSLILIHFDQVPK